MALNELMQIQLRAQMDLAARETDPALSLEFLEQAADYFTRRSHFFGDVGVRDADATFRFARPREQQLGEPHIETLKHDTFQQLHDGEYSPRERLKNILAKRGRF